MKRFVNFYSHEVDRQIMIALDISVTSNEKTQTVKIEVPQQRYEVTKEATYYTRTFEEVDYDT